MIRAENEGSGNGRKEKGVAVHRSALSRTQGTVTDLLRVETNDERGHVDDLLSDSGRRSVRRRATLLHPCVPLLPRNSPDVSLADEDTSVVDALGQSRLEHLGLETTLEEVLHLEGEDVIQSHPLLVQHTDSDQATDQSVALEQTLGVLLIQLEELTRSATNLGEHQCDPPDFTLVAQTELSRELELGVETRGLERSTRDLVGLRVVSAQRQPCPALPRPGAQRQHVPRSERHGRTREPMPI